MPEPAAIITAPGAGIPICRDEGRIGTDAPQQVIGHVCHVADPFNRALVSLAWRLDAAHAFPRPGRVGDMQEAQRPGRGWRI